MYASTTETALAHDVAIAVVRSAVSYPIATVSVPVNAGFVSGTAAINLLSSTNFPAGMLAVDENNQNYILLSSGDTLTVAALVAVNSGKQLIFHADYGNY